MFYYLSVFSFITLSIVIFKLFLFSLLSSFESGHYVVAFLKICVMFFFTYEIANEWLTYLKSKKNILFIHKLNKEDLITFISVLCATFITFLLNHTLSFGSVLASSIVGLIGVFVFKKYQISIYCGSFVGMASSSVFSDFLGIFLAALFSAILFVCASQVFKGFGGKLGAIAFLGTLLASLFVGTVGITMQPLLVSIDYWLFLYFIVGAMGTFLIHAHFHTGVVFSSGSMGLVFALLLPLLHGEAGKVLAVGLFCGSFVGMTSLEKLIKKRYIIIASIFATIIFSYTQPFFVGLGGKLGAVAFGSTIATAGFYNIFKRFFEPCKT